MRRRRLGVATLLVGLALVGMVASLSAQAVLGRIGGGPLAPTGALPGATSVASQVWVVRPGDTVWSIAQAVDPHGDVRPIVDRISAEMRGTQLYPGERVPIPTLG